MRGYLLPHPQGLLDLIHNLHMNKHWHLG